ncbi:MAG: hypothetical protein N3I35_06805 [Clostridia bacterium]|nr:hypothetical protein [Clostridia bacterium]
MKVINYCFTCHKEHDVTELDVMAKGMKCDCGGYYVTPSGKCMSKFIPETDEDYRLLGVEKKIKVWSIEHADEGMGWTDNTPTSFQYELENELDCNSECGYSKEDINPFIEQIGNMELGKEIQLGVFKIKCNEMLEKEFIALPEFTGW